MSRPLFTRRWPFVEEDADTKRRSKGDQLVVVQMVDDGRERHTLWLKSGRVERKRKPEETRGGEGPSAGPDRGLEEQRVAPLIAPRPSLS